MVCQLSFMYTVQCTQGSSSIALRDRVTSISDWCVVHSIVVSTHAWLNETSGNGTTLDRDANTK